MGRGVLCHLPPRLTENPACVSTPPATSPNRQAREYQDGFTCRDPGGLLGASSRLSTRWLSKEGIRGVSRPTGPIYAVTPAKGLGSAQSLRSLQFESRQSQVPSRSGLRRTWWGMHAVPSILHSKCRLPLPRGAPHWTSSIGGAHLSAWASSRRRSYAERCFTGGIEDRVFRSGIATSVGKATKIVTGTSSSFPARRLPA